jgi:C-terminal processing protease CtpA/Prc
MTNPCRLAGASLLTATMFCASVAGAKETHTRVDDFSWSDHGTSLALHSQDDSGVIVTRAEPEPFHGMRRGDRILAVDGKAVRQTEDITRALRVRTGSVSVRVFRGGAETTLVWSPADYRMFAPPPAPPPPPPPPRP